ncbi:hypothetical protein ACFP3I_03170 [Chryseobacterium arachidis]|uniref:hypothetical protein n=1 Tax=Chryseobacterium arachidis TaxID=1416778 RepID=UPI00361EE1D5
MTKEKSIIFNYINFRYLAFIFLSFLGAFSSFPLYLLGYGFHFVPAVPQKDVASIWAKKLFRLKPPRQKFL